MGHCSQECCYICELYLSSIIALVFLSIFLDLSERERS